ncbi:amino acid permease [Streptoalloteichus hindustanus]|uniref:Amino acid/polyamine/organocation transporter, APC superfamily n=1 Tax=Streptoalloteichus hindustanus TaxID=2017 RepID=A0A1M5DSH2_STRHI|nr:amino acid permease [Streptoalloteichus hindustanus]SHF69919.1 amino acid/polyamine/organocation transporter, APC superfamily [Streptoalloteichus hindustanus]
MAANQASPTPGRALGPWAATALVVGNMVGSGVFLLPSALAAYGGISVVGWLATATGAVLLALVFASLGRSHPDVGGPYAYTRRAFGDFLGFQTAWGYWIAVWAGNAAIAVALVGSLAHFWPALATDRPLAALTALAAIWGVTAVNALGTRQGGVVQLVTTALKLAPLLAVAVVGPFLLEPAHFTPFNASGDSGVGAVAATAALTLWAFIGIESATVPAGDVRDAARTIPRATVVGTVVTALIYVLGTVGVLGVVPRERLSASTAPFADAAAALFGGWAGSVVAAGAAVAAFGALNGWVLLQGQVPMAAARDGLFPAVFARTSRDGTPVFGLVLSSVLVTLLVLTNYTASLVDQFSFVILLATFTTLVPYAYSAMADLMLLATEGEPGVPRRRVARGAVALLAFGYSLWAIAGAGRDVVFRGTLLLLAGMPVYVWLHHRRRERRGPAETPPSCARSEPDAPVESSRPRDSALTA